MTTLNPYLTFNGNCEEAFNFYKTVFKSDAAFINRFSEMPPNPEFPILEEDKNRIMHISLPINEHFTLMGSDTLQSGEQATRGSNFSISIQVNKVEEAERIFNELSSNGIVKMPLNQTFWDAYFGMFIDKFGIQWMVNCPIEK